MIKNTTAIREELNIMQDNLNALKHEFENEFAFEGYVLEKLEQIENVCKYIKSITEQGEL